MNEVYYITTAYKIGDAYRAKVICRHVMDDSDVWVWRGVRDWDDFAAAAWEASEYVRNLEYVDETE